MQQAAAALPAPPSFFEATTALALDAFRTAGVDVAVLEVGLGGRLDATNVVTPVAVAITRVDFDHEQFLGHTLEAIAREKAGIIKPGRPVVLGDNPPAVTQVVTETCARLGARLVRAPDGVAGRARMVDGRARLTLDTPQRGYGTLTLGLRGRHQVENAIVAVRVLEEVSTLPDFDVSSTAITTAVEEVVWPGRLELLREGTGREVLLDGAHNPSGARALAAYLAETYARPLPIVLGAMRDKDLEALVAALAPAALALLCTAPASGRAARPADLATVAARVAPEVPVEVMADPMAAVARAAALGSPAVVAGSLYLAGEIRAHLS